MKIKCKGPFKIRCITCLFRNETGFGTICNLAEKWWGKMIVVTVKEGK